MDWGGPVIQAMSRPRLLGLEKVEYIFELLGAAFCWPGHHIGNFHFLDGLTFYEMEPLDGRLAIGTNASRGGVGAKRDKYATREQDDDNKRGDSGSFLHAFNYKAEETIRQRRPALITPGRADA